MVSNISSIPYINGESGIYNNKIQDGCVRYGRNSVANQKDFFKYNITSEGVLPDMTKPVDITIARKALMGAAYEEMGKQTSIPTAELTKGLNDAFNEIGNEKGIEFSAEAADLNHDGVIDIAEYGSTILVSDALSTNQNSFSPENVNGFITDIGELTALNLAQKQNYEIATRVYRAMYDYFGLEGAKNEFLANENNLI